MKTIETYLRLLRINQWVKNAFVFAPLFFSGQLRDTGKLGATVLASLAFCLVASSVYVLNDIRDATQDRLHPDKRSRPIAAGLVSPIVASVIGIICAIAALLIAGACRWPTVLIIAFYLGTSAAYCLGLKNVAVADVFIVALGFVLRVLAGGVAAEVAVSQWLVIMTFLISLFLALGKRRDDLTILSTTGTSLRKSLGGYTIAYVDVCMGMLSAVLVMCYILYCLSPDVTHRRHGELVYLSALFVLAGMFRYLQVTIVHEGSFSPTRVLYSDRFIQAAVASWILFFSLILYV